LIRSNEARLTDMHETITNERTCHV